MNWIVLNCVTIFVIFQLLTFTEQKVVIAENLENEEDETWLVDDEVSLFLYYFLQRTKTYWGGEVWHLHFHYFVLFCRTKY